MRSLMIPSPLHRQYVLLCNFRSQGLQGASQHPAPKRVSGRPIALRAAIELFFDIEVDLPSRHLLPPWRH